jgi:hypothetical protein
VIVGGETISSVVNSPVGKSPSLWGFFSGRTGVGSSFCTVSHLFSNSVSYLEAKRRIAVIRLRQAPRRSMRNISILLDKAQPSDIAVTFVRDR